MKNPYSDEHFMREALLEARIALSRGEIPVGAVMVSEGIIVGRGRNSTERGALPFAHAEMLALSDAGANLRRRRFDGCTLYITLEPCPMCAGAIMQTRVSRVVYGAKDPRAGAAGTLYDILRDSRIAHKCDVTDGILASEASDLLRTFFRAKR
ncbi:MAG: tRNA adenosine(34) deaminase TadA [Synergistaceae bacterium]|jgi:tRNA(adenine34) deaminase|nr:tRNA adenosine(34) deaminase TadA [Synergistaceae bacterium]